MPGVVPGGEGGPQTGESPTWVAGMSPAPVAAAESCQAPAPLLPPPRNAARARAKSLPRQLPTGTHRVWGGTGMGQEVPPAAVPGWQQDDAHPVAHPCSPGDSPASPVHPEQAPHVLHSLLGTPRSSQHSAVWMQPWHSPAQPGWSQEGPDPWGQVQDPPGAAGHKWGQLGNAPGKPGLSTVLGEPAAPTQGVPVCHHGQEQGDIQTCQTLTGMPQPSDRVMDAGSTAPDLSTGPRD